MKTAAFSALVLAWVASGEVPPKAQRLDSVQSLDTEAQPSSIVLHARRQMLLVSSFGGDVVQSFSLRAGCGLSAGESYAAGKGPSTWRSTRAATSCM